MHANGCGLAERSTLDTSVNSQPGCMHIDAGAAPAFPGGWRMAMSWLIPVLTSLTSALPFSFAAVVVALNCCRWASFLHAASARSPRPRHGEKRTVVRRARRGRRARGAERARPGPHPRANPSISTSTVTVRGRTGSLARGD